MRQNPGFLQEPGRGRRTKKTKCVTSKNKRTMEEKSNLTAERSLEIITEQIERSRQAVAKNTGQTLYISGLCMVGWSLLIGLCIYFTGNLAFYLLYILLPLIIYVVDRYAKRNRSKVPESLVGNMVDKTWQTFGIFVLSYFVLANLYNALMSHESPEVYMRLQISPLRTILLLMGMAITINGYILKSRWLVWCGIIGGIGGFFWESFHMTQMLVGRFGDYTNANYRGITHGIAPAVIIALFAFIGLTLPGWMMKRK